MGKNPTDAKTKALNKEKAEKEPRTVLRLESYVKKNGAIGLKRYYTKEVV
jgi:hypothetical protein